MPQEIKGQRLMQGCQSFYSVAFFVNFLMLSRKWVPSRTKENEAPYKGVKTFKEPHKGAVQPMDKIILHQSKEECLASLAS